MSSEGVHDKPPDDGLATIAPDFVLRTGRPLDPVAYGAREHDCVGTEKNTKERSDRINKILHD
jgi:hypothetical protein